MKTKETGILRGMIIAAIVGVTGSSVMAQDVTRVSAETVTNASTQVATQVTTQAATQAVFVQPPQHSFTDRPDADAEEFVLLVEQVETQHGPFDYRLSEPLQAAGSALEKQGDFQQALRLYDRALHVTRINSGLYSEAQVAIVEKMINANVALENWAVVDDQFRYLHLLYTRLYKDGTPELRRGLAQISDWHVLAINNDFGTDRVDHLREANKLFNQRLTMMEGIVADDDPVMHTLRYNISITQYHLRLLSSGGGNDAIFNRFEEQFEDQLAVLD